MVIHQSVIIWLLMMAGMLIINLNSIIGLIQRYKHEHNINHSVGSTFVDGNHTVNQVA